MDEEDRFAEIQREDVDNCCFPSQDQRYTPGVTSKHMFRPCARKRTESSSRTILSHKPIAFHNLNNSLFRFHSLFQLIPTPY
jgi:hypothetical protein